MISTISSKGLEDNQPRDEMYLRVRCINEALKRKKRRQWKKQKQVRKGWGGGGIGQIEELESGYVWGLSNGKIEVWMERMLKTHMQILGSYGPSKGDQNMQLLKYAT